MLSTATLDKVAPGQRVIFVGDIHGCIDEFNHLLQECRYNQENDVLVLVGDLVNKGYDSVAVVKRAMQLNAHCVLGNHDAALIARVDHIREGEIDPKQPPYNSDPLTKTAQDLPRDCYKWLSTRPHLLVVPQFHVIVAHAGLNPKQPLDNQNLWELLHMRRILPNGRVTDAQNGGDLWATKWKGPETVIFGHDARTGFQQHPFAIGLDTGCCYGGDLTAYILPAKQFVKVSGSRVAVQKKPANASPATAIGFSPSVELPGAGSINTRSPGQTPPLTASELTDKIKSMLSVGGTVKVASSAGASPAMYATPEFPAAPPAPAPREPMALESSVQIKHQEKRQATAPTHAGTASVTTPQQPQPRSATQQQHQAAPPQQPQASASTQPEIPLTRSAAAAAAGGEVRKITLIRDLIKPKAPVQQAPPNTASVPPSHAPEPAQNGALKATAPPPSSSFGGVAAPWITHVFDTATSLLRKPSRLAGEAALSLLGGDVVEKAREGLLASDLIPITTWTALLNGLCAYCALADCDAESADEACGWIQDIATDKRPALEAVDRGVVLDAVTGAPNVSRSTKRSTVIALRR